MNYNITITYKVHNIPIKINVNSILKLLEYSCIDFVVCSLYLQYTRSTQIVEIRCAFAHHLYYQYLH